MDDRAYDLTWAMLDKLAEHDVEASEPMVIWVRAIAEQAAEIENALFFPDE